MHRDAPRRSHERLDDENLPRAARDAVDAAVLPEHGPVPLQLRADGAELRERAAHGVDHEDVAR